MLWWCECLDKGKEAMMKLVVVGGVAGGLSCAARARRLDENAEIVVFEKGSYPSFSNCGLPYHLGGEIPSREMLLLNTSEALRAKLNLDVRLNHEVTGLDASAKTVTVRDPGGREFQESYDFLVLSPGARAARPPIPGLDSPRVHPLRTVDDVTHLVELVEGSGVGDIGGGTPAKSAVVIGGGFIGIEAAEALVQRGLQTTIVEGSAQVMPLLDREIANMVTGALGSLGIAVFADTRVESILPGAAGAAPGAALQVKLSSGAEIPADLVVLAAGVTPNTEAFVAAGVAADQRGYLQIDAHGRTNLPDVFALGDAATQVTAPTGATRPVALAGSTNRAGRLIADFIVDPESARPLPRPLSTSIFRVGPMTVAQTGANRDALAAAGVDFHTIHTHPTDHGTFLPGAQPMQLLMHFEAGSGRILGAQGIGGNGVDKRIDVIATALRAGLSAADLIDLDLAYSPPYGSAKDPVNFLGYVAQNVLSGRLELWYAAEAEALVSGGALVVDVRQEPEFRAGHLVGARCVPLTQLRGRLDEIRAWLAGASGSLGANPGASSPSVAPGLSAVGSLGDCVYLCDDTGVNAWLASRILSQNGINAKVLSGGVNTVFAYHFLNPGVVLEM
ncbi:pyridine nucleotide-disulfide oxidoreductase [Mobiluncus mulieris]|uniref:Pyridine nucleotide-disulfide oxidoreductase n=2 Tax=Mobiluncus mulieris TaxID=2052 RepID=A0ABD4TZS0_9ACTO|nr:pyridine nucleotide-disulfide oxidoreductase [Mobiluncus mulieris]MCV0010123.1 pyridine nucleotide-disulfide oxidoreductase [Mobiluncus mulieris]NMW74673.1 FAD-dependent oxidoreductase [Mobiluncus mulieris]NMX00518.1 FAD-dependent oxidoreductase [Mobiluncus mulieris]